MLNALKKIIEAKLANILELRDERQLKEDGSYVTSGDLLVQQLITDFVSRNHPDVTILSEELADIPNDLHLGKLLIVDPIDGTENFTSGLPEWGVSLCLYQDGRHVESLLFCPELNLSVASGDRPTHTGSRIAGISSSLTREDILRLEPGFEDPNHGMLCLQHDQCPPWLLRNFRKSQGSLGLGHHGRFEHRADRKSQRNRKRPTL